MRFGKLKTVSYWVATGLVALQFVVGGVFGLVRPPEALAGIEHLGYPAYFSLLLGGWKILGALALLAPRYPRLKEWAYAGIFFDLTGAAFSHAAVGDGPADIVVPLVLVALLYASWALRPASRTLLANARERTTTSATLGAALESA